MTTSVQKTILEQLTACRLAYRHVFGLLDPEYTNLHWGEERPVCQLEVIVGVAVLLQEPSAFSPCTVLGEIPPCQARELAAVLTDRHPEEILVLGDKNFQRMQPHFTQGVWRLSHNYGVTVEAFQPRPSAWVRRLTPGDRDALARRCEETERFRNPSTWRDFEAMVNGWGQCYGAFTGEALVGFCSTNPNARGITEISWLVVEPGSRRQGLASGLLTAAAADAFVRGDNIGYYAGSAGDDLHAMLSALGFSMLPSFYRFIPVESPGQWRTSFGQAV